MRRVCVSRGASTCGVSALGEAASSCGVSALDEAVSVCGMSALGEAASACGVLARACWGAVGPSLPLWMTGPGAATSSPDAATSGTKAGRGRCATNRPALS